MIRNAHKQDIEQILELGEKFFELAGWPKYCDWDEFSVIQTLEKIIAEQIPGLLIVAEDIEYNDWGNSGKIVGIAAALIFPFYFNLNVIVGQELFWYGDCGIEMEKFMEQQAKEKFGASIFIMASVAGLRDKALERLYRMQGYDPCENTFIRRL